MKKWLHEIMDKIIINNLLAYGILGIYPNERHKPQNILINITLYLDTSLAAQSDDIADCVDYGELAQKVKTHAETAARFTVEALTNDIANICLREKGVKKVCVRIEKPDAVLFAESVGVEIERSQM